MISMNENNRIEVLAGIGFANAVKVFNLQANRTFSNGTYEVWEVDEQDLQRIEQIPETNWSSDFGWYRCGNSCFENTLPMIFIVNGKMMFGFDGETTLEESDNNVKSREYENLTAYLKHELGCSKVTNIACVCADIATKNMMTMANLFEEYGLV